VAQVERPPAATEVRLEPCTEIHRRVRRRDVDIGDVAEDVACRDVQRAAKGHREVREVPTRALALLQDISGGRRPGARAVRKVNLLVDPVAEALRLIQALLSPQSVPLDRGPLAWRSRPRWAARDPSRCPKPSGEQPLSVFADIALHRVDIALYRFLLLGLTPRTRRASQADGVCDLVPHLVGIELQTSVGVVHFNAEGSAARIRTRRSDYGRC
jgi:hypothetical protein